ncbi:SidA/IucD/PvdA family monooxygenase [Streptomyces sp. NPDC086010]|uniref:SidA/IucD/PvdA family monooxygenase n=1 Tax=Streptomyces sp. NPDC086010 TaxID=3365745 RepID=UPI0037D8E888
MADPTSPYSSCVPEGARHSLLVPHPGELCPLRTEYDDYCRWAAARLSSIRFNQTVQSVTPDKGDGLRRPRGPSPWWTADRARRRSTTTCSPRSTCTATG